MNSPAIRVLITGASGFIGRHTVSALSLTGTEIHAALRRPWLDAPPSVVQHIVDLTDVATVNRIVHAVAPSHLLHLSWDVQPGRFWSASTNLDWVAASLHLYRAFAAAGGSRVIIAGTCAEYDWSLPLLDEATTPLLPRSLYGAAKHGLHTILAQAAAQDGIELAWARIFMPYGPYEHEARLIPSVARALLAGQPVACGEGNIQRDLIHVADVAGALLSMLESNYVGAVNVASGICTPLRNAIGIIGDLIGRPDLIRYGARSTPPDEPDRLAAVTNLLHDRLGFRPRFTLQTGIADAVNWWRSALPQSVSR